MRSFKDYCLILQVHPEADAAMIEAAYWHLARRYNEAALHDPLARAKLEELNEAYSVLGSPERREEYMKHRAQVLGEGALPVPPPPAPEPPPLAVMARQRPRPREEESAEPLRRGLARLFRPLRLPALCWPRLSLPLRTKRPLAQGKPPPQRR